MASIWVEGVGRSIEQALDLLAAAVGDCSDELWETAMWPVAGPSSDRQFLGPDWTPITDAAERAVLAQRWVERWATPWSVAWHALETLDYDLHGEFGPWSPPPPFAAHPHWRDLPQLPAPWSRDEVAGYIDYCHRQVQATLAGMTEETAARPLPAAHRYAGQPHASVIVALVVHTTEHAAQIRQFLAPSGPDPGRKVL